MTGRFPIEIAPERGYVRLGGVRLALGFAAGDTLRVARSARLRGVTFAERGTLVLDALVADDAAWALATALVQRSVIDAGDLEHAIAMALAVALAGGGEETLSFAEAARLAGQRKGWSWERTLTAPAWLVDRIAAEAGPDAGWSTIVFAPGDTSDMNTMARAMSENLLRRSVEPGTLPGAQSISEAARSQRARAGADLKSATVPVERTVEPPAHALARPVPVASGAIVPVAGDSSIPPPRLTTSRVPASAAGSHLSHNTVAAVPRPATTTWHTSSPGLIPIAPAVWAGVPAMSSGAPRWKDTEARPGAASVTRAAPVPPPMTAAAASTEPLARRAVCRPAPPEARAIDLFDWLDGLADALADECDLRGLDR